MNQLQDSSMQNLRKKQSCHYRTSLLVPALIFLMLASGCVSKPAVQTALPTVRDNAPAMAEKETVETLLVRGGPQDLRDAVEFAASFKYLSKDKSAVYTWLAFELAKLVYPELMASEMSPADAPQDAALVRLFIDARNGRPVVLSDTSSALEELMPVLVAFRFKTAAASSSTLSAAERFTRLGKPSVIADMARGLALERTGDVAAAASSFEAALVLSPDCYPASISLARVLISQGRPDAALKVLDQVDSVISGVSSYRRVRASALYAARRYQEADPMITAILLDDPMNAEFMLMRAHLLIEKQLYKQALPLLDAYASVDPNNKLYLLLRARTSLENAKDRSSAISVLRRALTLYPDDQALALYAASALASGTDVERTEAIVLAGKVLGTSPDSLPAMRILLAAHIAFGDFVAAMKQADAIVAISPPVSDFGLFFAAYKGGGRLGDAKKIAGAWLKAEPASETAALSYATILIDTDDRKLASELIAALLGAKGSPSFKSNLFFLQSKLQASPDLILASLRSALVEDGMNVEALLGMFDYYMNLKDNQRARFYLKQAFSLAPERKDVLARKAAMAQLGIAIP